jgi:hypothetical protein
LVHEPILTATCSGAAEFSKRSSPVIAMRFRARVPNKLHLKYSVLLARRNPNTYTHRYWPNDRSSTPYNSALPLLQFSMRFPRTQFQKTTGSPMTLRSSGHYAAPGIAAPTRNSAYWLYFLALEHCGYNDEVRQPESPPRFNVRSRSGASRTII